MSRKHKHGKHLSRVASQANQVTESKSQDGLAVLYDWYQSRIEEFKRIALAWLEYTGSTPEHRYRMFLKAQSNAALYDFKASRLIDSL